MAWIELHQSLPQHRKLLALRDALGLRTPAAIGHMCLLWLWALDNAPDGDLSALPAKQLARSASTPGTAPATLRRRCARPGSWTRTDACTTGATTPAA